MYKNLVLKYINNLQPIHIKTFATNNNIYVTDDEVLIIYKFIKENYLSLLEDDQVLNKLKPTIRNDLFISIKKLYKEYKNKYL